MTKICEFPYPIYDLTKNVALNRVEEGKAQMVERVRDEEVASSSKKNELKSKNWYPIHDQSGGKMAKINIQFMTKTVQKPYPLGPYLPM